MAHLSALLPMNQAVACHSALVAETASQIAAGQAEGRTPNQVGADVFVERLTGQTQASKVAIEVQLVMTDATLFRDDAAPGWFPGHGPVPADTARHLVSNPEAEAFLRRLYTHPHDGQLVAMDSQRRGFSGLLRRMVLLRDDVCRTPYCDAPIRQIDHATPHQHGGPTNWENASGLCTRCNLAKERPGWKHHATPEQLDVTTPTGHHYRYRTRPLTRETANSA
ncbi:HNH endonuclease [Citricoccus sp. GCM10030269]|uniref:HNH endonuclease n=1 Tax=Citricoccus sp. GCM10030269 TaxID=3273388 RepID=UPI003621C8E9